MEIEEACAHLLGPEFCVRSGWQGRVDRHRLKQAFRQRVFAAHPDRASSLGVPATILQERFLVLQQSYTALLQLLSQPAASPKRSAPPRAKPKKRPPSKETARQGPASQVFFAGQAPSRSLKLGEFLYYNGYISQQELFDAVRWQRRQRPRVGEIAQSFGFLDPVSISHLLELRQGSRKLNEPLAEFARNQGYLSHFQWMAVVGRQRRLQKPIGHFWIQSGLFSVKSMADLVEDQRKHNWYFGRP